MSTPLRIGIAGLGTVGLGVIDILRTHATTIAMRAGRPVEITAISARSRRDRGIDLSAYAFEADPADLATRDDVDLVVEVIGGENGPAKETVEAALASGKHVVTANKALMARHGTALAALAERHGACLRYEAGVAGGIPVVKALTEGLAANAVTRVMGVMNGTCNYILTKMEATGEDYSDVLTEAQALGYAEADPAFDVGGMDAAQKLALLTIAAFGTHVDIDAVKVEGIEQVTLTDIRYARDLGYRIKLLGVARSGDGAVEVRMQPCLVPAQSPIGQLESVVNMVVIEGDFVGQTVFQGPGAGAGPTGSAVVADIIDIARDIRVPTFGVPVADLREYPTTTAGSPATYYLRLTLEDRPGMLAKVAAALGQHGISINQMRQTEHEGGSAPVLIVTHACLRQDLDKALDEITGQSMCQDTPVAYRIETV
ncbi:homoserine dehydrogenase [Algicella marina]|uniref:Homoserine dehydrogenase n=1 Tax=Algicella marina TaxID=2683284 RepID=A0A6P1T1L5_9RHOB|nr:homoserine dehydrogenase [Algicella marina]QHQ35631.1 homoserine dehydrogenase [Algicella marina]